MIWQRCDEDDKNKGSEPMMMSPKAIRWMVWGALLIALLSACEKENSPEEFAAKEEAVVVDEEIEEAQEEQTNEAPDEHPSEEQMKAAMQSYIDGFNQKDADLLASLFAAHARIEDPVGGGRIVEGKEAITAFYQGAVTMVDRLELEAPIRASRANSAAMAFTIYMTMDGQEMVGRTIDVMTFDGAGKIIDMKAYHGQSDWE